MIRNEEQQEEEDEEEDDVNHDDHDDDNYDDDQDEICSCMCIYVCISIEINRYPASPNIYYTTIIPGVLLHKVMQDSRHQQYPGLTCVAAEGFPAAAIKGEVPPAAATSSTVQSTQMQSKGSLRRGTKEGLHKAYKGVA